MVVDKLLYATILHYGTRVKFSTHVIMHIIITSLHNILFLQQQKEKLLLIL